ncbi:sacsin N-terminal ATP-binding-like domain-containing protein [Candidatus Palauibacter sp.]|uniref:sacsin N-terminal ATP-binding-like domain-containing protein n=1 Tax=Candidatus Palauibacter sp. TaxID=3101350 RepID=UPI003AF318E2
MQEFATNFVNLIADNLRDRYENGFPILKELIQNADDAKARTLIFGRHPGFSKASHPLLQGPGLWFFNDGDFTKSDADALRSFGITSKGGDPRTIGKFGLGMKSVFHLCEAEPANDFETHDDSV